MRGKWAKAIDDKSGFKIPYKNLKTQWDGLRTADPDFEPKHPQLNPPPTRRENRPLPGARPDNDIATVEYNFANAKLTQRAPPNYDPNNHDFSADTFKIAFYEKGNPFGSPPNSYTTTDEVTGPDYKTGGYTVEIDSPTTVNGQNKYPALAELNNPEFAFSQAIVYNISNNEVIKFIEFPFDTYFYDTDVEFIWNASTDRDSLVVTNA